MFFLPEKNLDFVTRARVRRTKDGSTVRSDFAYYVPLTLNPVAYAGFSKGGGGGGGQEIWK